MIKNKKDLKKYLIEDFKANNYSITYSTIGYLLFLIKIHYDRRLLFHYVLRKDEYYRNTVGYNPIRLILKGWYKYRHQRLGEVLGIHISANCCEKGLRVAHYGSIIVNGSVKIGKNCVIHSCVNIAENTVIGDNCYIGPGAKIFANLRIANNVKIGANTVVTKSIDEENVTVIGVPGKIMKR